MSKNEDGADGTKEITSLVISRFCQIRKPLPLPQEAIPQKIAYFRKLKGLNQEELAKLAGVSRSIIAWYEQNRIENFNPRIVLRIAKALRLNPTDLLPSNNGHCVEISLSIS